jgi:CheY-like chemotaxis protein
MPKKILVVEDNQDTRELFVFLLKSLGFEVVAATDGHKGLECARAEAPDLILTDINMPNLNGIDMIRMLRAEAAFRTVPIVAITAYDTAFHSEATAAGATIALRKPIEFDQLTGKIEQLLQA